MTYLQLYRDVRARLVGAAIEAAACEALLIIEHYCGLAKTELLVHGDERVVTSAEAEAVLSAVRRRARHYPLQYILGKWQFMDLTLLVGEGVLIPREDTEVLVNAAAAALGCGNGLYGVDLCAGTGAVGLSLSRLCPGVRITAVELHSAAYDYLTKNISRYPKCMVQPLRGDVLSPELARCFDRLDFIVSNPPYIASCELPELQAEVRLEPQTALSGGSDGLDFYRAIAKLWVPRLKAGGIIALETGDTQAAQVIRLLEGAGTTGCTIHKDFSGLDRVITGIKHAL